MNRSSGSSDGGVASAQEILSVVVNQRASLNKTKKRRRSSVEETKHNNNATRRIVKKNKQEWCSFCSSAPANVVVTLTTTEDGKRKVPTSFCWLHYYTTRAVRVDPNKFVEIADAADDPSETLEASGVQRLFAEAWTELKQELVEESARSFQRQQKDPLAILRGFAGTQKKKKPKSIKVPPLLNKKREGEKDGGGFLRQVPVPERFLKAQAKLHQQEEMANNPAAKMPKKKKGARNPLNLSVTGNPYERRKASRKPIFSIALDTSIKAPSTKVTHTSGETCPACGSTDVSSTGDIMSRNNDVAKAETWGTKGDDEVVVRYHCNSCGKRWNEE